MAQVPVEEVGGALPGGNHRKEHTVMSDIRLRGLYRHVLWKDQDVPYFSRFLKVPTAGGAMLRMTFTCVLGIQGQ